MVERERGGPQNEDPLLCTLTQQQKRQERSFEQGVKRFSCLIQPPRKLSKTKDPSRDYCTHVLSMLWELKMKLFLKISQFLLHFLPHSLSLSILFPSNRHSRLIFCSPADQMKTRNTEHFIYLSDFPTQALFCLPIPIDIPVNSGHYKQLEK